MTVAELTEALMGLDPSLAVVVWTPYAAEGYGEIAEKVEVRSMVRQPCGGWSAPWPNEQTETVALIS